jgi:hypothetical protein
VFKEIGSLRRLAKALESSSVEKPCHAMGFDSRRRCAHCYKAVGSREKENEG